MTDIVAAPQPGLALPALITAANDQAQMRFVEFFAADIRNRPSRPEAAILAKLKNGQGTFRSDRV